MTPEQLGAATNAELSGSCPLAPPLTVTPVSFLALWRPPELYMLHSLSLYGGEVPPPSHSGHGGTLPDGQAWSE